MSEHIKSTFCKQDELSDNVKENSASETNEVIQISTNKKWKRIDEFCYGLEIGAEEDIYEEDLDVRSVEQVSGENLRESLGKLWHIWSGHMSVRNLKILK